MNTSCHLKLMHAIPLTNLFDTCQLNHAGVAQKISHHQFDLNVFIVTLSYNTDCAVFLNKLSVPPSAQRGRHSLPARANQRTSGSGYWFLDSCST